MRRALAVTFLLAHPLVNGCERPACDPDMPYDSRGYREGPINAQPWRVFGSCDCALYEDGEVVPTFVESAEPHPDYSLRLCRLVPTAPLTAGVSYSICCEQGGCNALNVTSAPAAAPPTFTADGAEWITWGKSGCEEFAALEFSLAVEGDAFWAEGGLVVVDHPRGRIGWLTDPDSPVVVWVGQTDGDLETVAGSEATLTAVTGAGELGSPVTVELPDLGGCSQSGSASLSIALMISAVWFCLARRRAGL